uniref:Putative ovule protein n=1 Tax=Solanum chacoense TaxID=4108 RepID=A0A0V0I306_SOLCH
MENEKLHHDSSGPLYLTIQEWQGLSKAFDRNVKLLSNYREAILLSSKVSNFIDHSQAIRELAENLGLNYDDYGWGRNPHEEENDIEVAHDSEEDD